MTHIFFKKQQLETKELKASIRDKAIESFVILEKKIFPLCAVTSKESDLILTVVIDDDGIDSMENTLAELSGVATPEGNTFEAIKSSLKRLVGQVDASGQKYYYDKIRVLSAQDYEAG